MRKQSYLILLLLLAFSNDALLPPKYPNTRISPLRAHDDDQASLIRQRKEKRRKRAAPRTTDVAASVDDGVECLEKAANLNAPVFDISSIVNDMIPLTPIADPSASIRQVGFDDLFPGIGVSISDLFDSSDAFREDIREAARKDFISTHDLSSSNKDSMMSSWYSKEEGKRVTEIHDFSNLDDALKKYLSSDTTLTGKQFIEAITDLVDIGNKPDCFGSFMDIVGIHNKRIPHSWHQDSGRDHYTVMVGFPAENHYKGLGVFSHAVRISHTLPAPKIRAPRLWPLIASSNQKAGQGKTGPDRAQDELMANFEEKYIIRPFYQKGKEILIFHDSEIFHSAPDFAKRRSLWRFM